MTTESGIRPSELATTEDDFLGGRLTLAQPKTGSRAGLDALFLAAACPAKAGQKVLDAGSGSGIVALALARRVEGAEVTGIEIDAELCALARGNAARNALSERARFICGDLTAPVSRLFDAGLAPDSFDHAVANPPFLSEGKARLPPDPMLRRAHGAAPGDLELWFKCLAALVKPRGTITVVHRAEALPQLLKSCESRFGDLVVYPLFPRESSAACRILIQGRKASRAPLHLAAGMVLHGGGNAFSEAAQALLRDGAGLDLRPGK